jgi:hypothetical protein
LNRNLQPGIHPDADKLSVFIEGAATAREQEWMLAHLAECTECRKVVFLMQPHEEVERTTATPVKGWVWRLLVPIGLPAAAIACGVIAVFIYIRPHGDAPSHPQQIASVKRPEIEHPGAAVAPSTNSERVAQSEGPQNSFAPGGAATEVSRRKNLVGGGLNLHASKKSAQATANVAASETTAEAPSASVTTADAALTQNVVSSATVSDLPLNGRSVASLPQLQPPGTKGAASQNGLVMKKDLPALQIQGASGQVATFAGVSGRITDPTGAVISGAMVTLRDAAGKMRETTTASDGSFHLTELPAGQYELMATARGFKTSKQSIELKPSELATLQPKLDVGVASEQVTVEASAVQEVQTESANVSQVDAGRVVAEMPSAGRVTTVPSDLPISATVSHGKRFLSLDSAGNLFLSRHSGKKWKKINPQWAGKAVRIELTPAYSSEAPPKAKTETSAPASEGAVFQLTTDTGAVWNSKDGAHWHQR